MGTSKSNPGPTGVNPLLPPWAPEPVFPTGEPEQSSLESEAGEAPEQTGPADPADQFRAPGSWGVPRRAIGQLSAGPGTGSRGRTLTQRTVSGAVRALGGARGATSSARAGRAAAQRYGAFLATTATRGLAEAARAFGLDAYLGADVEVFLARLAEALAPDVGMMENDVAAAALSRALDDLFDRYAVAEGGLAALDRLTPDSVAEALQSFVAHYAFERILEALSSRIENRAISPERAVEVERQVWEYVVDTVAFETEGRDLLAIDWRGAEGKDLVEGVFRDGFAVLKAAR